MKTGCPANRSTTAARPARGGPPLPLLLGVCLLLGMLGVARAETNAVETAAPARIRVSGFGLLGNRTLRSMLRELLPDKQAPVLDANFIEDAFLILHNRLVDQGHLNPLVRADLTLTNGQPRAISWDGKEELGVPRDVRAGAARFEVIPGVLFFYDELLFEGLSALPESRAAGFFTIQDTLLNLKSARRFSAARLRSSVGSLRRELENLGYREAVVRAQEPRVNAETGAVRVVIEVEEGPRSVVRSLQWKLLDAGEAGEGKSLPVRSDQAFSPAWEQDAAHAAELQSLRQGYPDARARMVEAGRSVEAEGVQLDLVAEVTRRERVELGDVRFAGASHSRESFLQRRVRLDGPWLDRVEADRGRERLARLGSFRFVDVRLEPEAGSPRDVVYELTEGKRYELSLLAGYGSYDQLFGGFEFEHFNLWGVGHDLRLKAVQSFKSTHGIVTYVVPELLAPDLDLFASADAFQREELTFDRQEVKLSVGLRKQFPRSAQQVGLRYSYEFLDAQTDAYGDEATRAAAVIADWQIDRRDNPLLPRKGYRFYANTEFADTALGGRSEYLRLELGASYHYPFSRGLIAHFGLLQSLVTSPDRDTLLPFNKRFFPGGENSVRGYQQGGASPLDDNGEQIGAEAALQLNVELEERLTRTISLVGFVDAVGITPEIEDYPFDQVLWSVGGGLRWNTVIGPVRLEYGYNMNPRQWDPSGTLQFSIGYPF